MKNRIIPLLISCLIPFVAFSDNPFITHIYTADPTARVINGKLYVFPSTDVVCEEGFGNNGFCMPSYNVFSTVDTFFWEDHGLIVDQTDVPWGKQDGFGMWAPDCIEKDGKYYFYFPDIPTDESAFRRIGVAIADKPEGPYEVQEHYIDGISGIDPNVFIDDDGQAYIYWGGGETLYGAKLADNMIELASEPVTIETLPGKYKEGSYVIKRNGIYYFTFPHSPNGSEELAYAMGDSPLGPFEYKGYFMERWTDGCWTNHHSLVEYEGQWYVFYHHKDISNDQHLRSVCADYLEFNEDGTIQETKATLRGIGSCPSTIPVQIDRYSEKSDNVAVQVFKHELPGAWYAESSTDGSWIRYNRVDFGKSEPKKAKIRVAASNIGSVLELKLGGKNGDALATFTISEMPEEGDCEWIELEAKLKRVVVDIRDITCIFKSTAGGTLKVDWVQFE